MSRSRRGSSRAAENLYALVRVTVTVSVTGRRDVRVSMKPSGSTWEDVGLVWAGHVEGAPGLPTSPEEAAEIASTALRHAFPGLF